MLLDGPAIDKPLPVSQKSKVITSVDKSVINVLNQPGLCISYDRLRC